MVIFPTPIVSWLSPVSYHIAISHARKIFTTASEAHLKSPAGTGRCNEAVFTAEQHTNRQANYIGDKVNITLVLFIIFYMLFVYIIFICILFFFF